MLFYNESVRHVRASIAHTTRSHDLAVGSRTGNERETHGKREHEAAENGDGDLDGRELEHHVEDRSVVVASRHQRRRWLGLCSFPVWNNKFLNSDRWMNAQSILAAVTVNGQICDCAIQSRQLHSRYLERLEDDDPQAAQRKQCDGERESRDDDHECDDPKEAVESVKREEE